jgi:NAD(P)-dependent dehydrogenase (short-subunit alcohol dehydrogenase family)
MDNVLNNKIYVITGAGIGIGRATAFALAKAGATLIVTDLKLELAEQTASMIRIENGTAESLALDVTKSVSSNELAAYVYKKFGRIDGWVNNAGVSSMNRLINLTEADWNFNMDVNAKGVFFGCQAAARQMIKQEPDPKSGLRGKLINIASMAAKRGNAPFLAHYVASKFAVLGFTQAVAGELAEQRITANSVCPGYVATSMQDRELAWEAELRGISVDEVKKMYIADTPLRRIETAEDVASIVLFLASPLSDFMTGEAISINGGSFMD